MQLTNPKQENFRRLAEARVNKVIDGIRILGNLADKTRYEYTTQEAAMIMAAVVSAIDKCDKRFFPDEVPAEIKFSFSLPTQEQCAKNAHSYHSGDASNMMSQPETPDNASVVTQKEENVTTRHSEQAIVK